MARVVTTGSADADTAKILAYLARLAGPRLAGKYDAKFNAVYEHLALFPGVGAARAELGEGRRIITVAPYVIIYEQPDAGTVLILRIISGRLNITAALLRH